VHKRMAGTTEADEILKNIVSDAPPVPDVVNVDATIGRPTPPAAPSIPIMHVLAQ